jgi:hypothetical protein
MKTSGNSTGIQSGTLQNKRSCWKGEVVVKVGGGRWQEMGVGGWIWCKCCVYMYANAKMIAVKTIPGTGW